MTSDDRDCVQAAIEAQSASIVALSRALMLDDKEYPNAIVNYINKSRNCVSEATMWLNRIILVDKVK